MSAGSTLKPVTGEAGLGVAGCGESVAVAVVVGWSIGPSVGAAVGAKVGVAGAGLTVGVGGAASVGTPVCCGAADDAQETTTTQLSATRITVQRDLPPASPI